MIAVEVACPACGSAIGVACRETSQYRPDLAATPVVGFQPDGPVVRVRRQHGIVVERRPHLKRIERSVTRMREVFGDVVDPARFIEAGRYLFGILWKPETMTEGERVEIEMLVEDTEDVE